MTIFERRRTMRPTAWLVAASLAFPICFVGCGGKGADTSNVPPPVDDTRSGAMTTSPTPPATPPKTGMSTGKKVVVVLAGAALLYYLYRHHVKNEQGQEVQYYKSEKTGRIYYRDPKTHQAHWVTPAPNYQVDDQEAQELSKYQGYNSSTGGEDYKAPSADSGAAPE